MSVASVRRRARNGGFAADGREQLAFIEGEAAPVCWSEEEEEEAIHAAGELIRAAHEVAADFPHAGEWMPWVGARPAVGRPGDRSLRRRPVELPRCRRDARGAPRLGYGRAGGPGVGRRAGGMAERPSSMTMTSPRVSNFRCGGRGLGCWPCAVTAAGSRLSIGGASSAT